MNPSLLLIPDRYKADKLYSQIPDSGAGDLTFARNSNATRVNSAGLIEKVRENLALQSQTFDNASWTKYQSSVTANSTTAPDGTLTADTLADTAANDSHQLEQNIVFPASEVTISIFAKENTLSHIKITAYDGAAFQDSGIFNLSNGTVSGVGSIINVGNGWYRCSYTFSATGGAGVSYVFTSNGSSTIYAGSGQSVYIWGYQLETGVLTDYIPTTTAAVSVGITADIPRLDYTGGGCPSLLLEPQRTNLILRSEEFDNASWSKIDGSVTANAAISPDGTMSADLLLDDAADGNLRQVVTTTATPHTQSIYCKPFGRSGFLVWNSASYVDFDFNLVAVIDSASATGTITAVGNGWFRLTCTFSASAGTPNINFTNRGTGLVDGVSGVYIYGAQLEAGSYVSSYIPTLGSSVTRLADAASKTGISSLIGATEGTIFIEVDFDLGVIATDNSRIQLSDGTTSNWIFIGIPDGASSNLIRMYVNAPSGSMSEYSTNPLVNGVNKIAFGYKSGSFALYVNGVQAATSSTTLTMATCSRIDLQGDVPTASAKERTNYNQVALYTTRLSNSELASLTSL
jgi:hypothetical protein